MNEGAVWLALAVGVALGALAALLWRARREQSLRIETELLRARLKSEETVSAEREQALTRAREQLQGVFGELARDSLQSNSEVFLQLRSEERRVGKSVRSCVDLGGRRIIDRKSTRLNSSHTVLSRMPSSA